jgi:hypothetical protein
LVGEEGVVGERRHPSLAVVEGVGEHHPSLEEEVVVVERQYELKVFDSLVEEEDLFYLCLVVVVEEVLLIYY